MDTLVRKKASLIICILLVMTTMLCGCRVVDNITNGVNRKKEIETTSKQLMKYLVDENKVGLLSFFSSDIQDNHAQQIDLELDHAFDFINGKIVSYDYSGIYNEHESIDDGTVTRFDCDSKLSNVTTDIGLKYEIWITYYHIWEEKPEREGISKIRIIEEKNSKNRVEIGFFYEDD